MATEILVFIPGIIGSELWDGDDRVWPGSFLEAISGFNEARVQQLLKPGLVPRDIIRSAAAGLVSIYQPWIEAFEAISRGNKTLFREHSNGADPKTLFVFPYDWRLDLRDTAVVFADFLDAIVAKIDDADLKLVCHSMGGLVARYFLESGKFAARPSFARVSLFVTLGTPHNGAPVAFAGVAGKHKTSFLSIEQTRRLTNDSRYPSLYQLIPTLTHSFIWDQNPSKALESYAPDDPEIVKALSLNAASLTAWKDFRAGLTNDRPSHVRYFFIVGSRQSTPLRFLWTGTDVQLVDMDDAGDGTVSLPGGMDMATQTELVGKSHVSLIETKPARRTLAALFGAETLFSASELRATITLAVRDTAVTVEDEIHVLIEFTPQTDRFEGELRFQIAVPPQEGEAAGAFTFTDFLQARPVPIELTGAGVTYINVKVPPLGQRGIYRPVLTEAGFDEPIIGPAFAVQPE